MEVKTTEEFEKTWNNLLMNHKEFEDKLKERRRFVTTALENLNYEEALNTNYFEKLKNTSENIIHSVVVWKHGMLNVRFLCAVYNEKTICVYLSVFFEKKKSDYGSLISKVEIYAKQLEKQGNLKLWRQRR
jgi:hypothetical protein